MPVEDNRWVEHYRVASARRRSRGWHRRRPEGKRPKVDRNTVILIALASVGAVATLLAGILPR
jgi:hypothetical protein